MSSIQPISSKRAPGGGGCAAVFLGLFGFVFAAAGAAALWGALTKPAAPSTSLMPAAAVAVLFLAIGLAVIAGAVAIARQSRKPPPGRSAAASGAPAARDPRFTPASFSGTGSVDTSGPLILKATKSRIGAVVGMFFVGLFWNGITGLFTWGVYFKQQGDDGSWVKVFLIPFQIIGALIIWGFIHAVLALFTPRPTLTLARDRARLGHGLDVQWRLTGATSRIRSFTLSVVGTEEARFRRGTDTVTDRHEFYRAALVETSERGRIETGMIAVTLPRDTVPTLVADNNKIIWTLELKGDVSAWPDIDDKFEIQVAP
jgi:hypothetical protein